MSAHTRRDFIAQTGSVAAALAAAPLLGLETSSAFAQGAKKRLGWALCGLGGLSENQIAPALQTAKLSRLAGVITDTPAKASKWKAKFGLGDKSIFTYDTMHELAGIRHRRHLHRYAQRPCTPNRRRPPSKPASTCSARSRWRSPSRNASR
ncbi:MAG: twin-arginine translocation signal domain-containing protein [Gammaproteobacteria bacterium]